MPKKPLRFAPLIRVSTEKQEKKGESLRTQDKQTSDAIIQLGGVVGKRYAGQEHATEGWERHLLGELLIDAQKECKPFDAVMVCDASRWSRDNEKSKAGLRILRDNGIQFFTLTQEQNLYDPNTILFLGMAAEFGEYQARLQKKKSVESCIERATRTGAPTAGKPPYGRTWDRQTETWSVDLEKKAIIEDVAQRYLAGEQMPKLAKEVGLNHSFLHKTLTQRCGDRHHITWSIDDLNIHKTVEIEVPGLLPEKTILAIRQKAEANRTYRHGRPKHRYLLSGFVFCNECGYAMFGQTNHGHRRYHRHAHTARAKKCPLQPRPWVRCDELEHEVIGYLFEVFGNRSAMQRAITEATPNLDKLNELRDRYERLMQDVGRIKKARGRILDLISKDTITQEDAEDQLQKLKSREHELSGIAAQINVQLGNQPSPDAIRALAEKATKAFRKRVTARPTAALYDWEGMTWQDKRDLVETVFDGLGADGRPLGIYIEAIEGQNDKRCKRWAFRLRGHPKIDGDVCVMQSPSG